MQSFGKKIISVFKIAFFSQSAILILTLLHIFALPVQASPALIRNSTNPLLTSQNDELHVSNQYVLKEDSIYKMWYTTHLNNGSVISYITSSDGVNWEETSKTTVINPAHDGWETDVSAPTIIKDNDK